MTASRTVRCATEARIVELAAALPGWAATPTDGAWHVQLPPNGTPTSRRWVIIGLANGTLAGDTIASGHGPAVDSWGIQCAAGLTEVLDVAVARQACEDAVNDLADLFATDDRLGMPDGPRDVTVAAFSVHSEITPSGHAPFVRAEIEIRALADIFRNP